MSRKPSPLREQILEAAIKLLRESGLKKLAQPQVAKAAGIPQGHLTYYFPKRADLLLAIAEHSIFSVMNLVSGQLPFSAALRSKVLPILAEMVTDTNRTRMLLGLVVESDENPELRARMRETMVKISSLISNTFGRPDKDPKTSLVASAIWGLGLQHYLLDGERSEKETEELLRYLLEWAEKKES